MFDWLKVDESYVQNLKVFTFGVNLPGGVLLRTSQYLTLKHGESITLAETFVPGVQIKDGVLVPLVVPSASAIEFPEGQPFRRFRGSIQLMNGSLEHRGVSVLSKDWSERDVLTQLEADDWPVNNFQGRVVGWPSNHFEVHRGGGEPIFVFEYVGSDP